MKSRTNRLRMWGVLGLLLAIAVAGGYGQAVVPPPAIVAPMPELLRMELEEVVTISPEGDAKITRALIIPPSPLTKLYLEYWEGYEKEAEVRKGFVEELQKSYLILLGRPIVEPKILLVKPPVALLAIQPFKIEITATLPDLAKYVPEEKAWHVAVGPQVPETQKMAVDDLLNALVFKSLYLESLPKEQRLERRRTVRFELPKEAKILNREELARLVWSVDFGGGSFLRARLVVEDAVATFIEELIQTERPPEKLLEEKTALAIAKALAKHGVFTIKYSLPGVPPIKPIKPPVGFVPPTNFSGSWGYTYTRSVSVIFSHPATGSTATFSATPSLAFGAHLSWAFHWWGGLDWFKAYIDINPSITASFSVTITRGLGWETSRTLWSYPRDFVFCVGTFPVWIRLSIEAGTHMSASAAAAVTFTAEASAGTRKNRLGAKWDDGRWRKIEEKDPFASSLRFSVTTGATATATAGPWLSLAAYVYNVAGPFVRLTAYLEGELRVRPNTCILSAGFKVSGGVRLAGWLRSILRGLGSYETDFYTWEREIWRRPPPSPCW